MLTPSREHATRRALVFASPEFFYFLVRRYSDVSCSQVCRKLAARRELLDGLIHVASEYRHGGGTLFGVGEALFVATSCRRASGRARPWGLRRQGALATYQLRKTAPTYFCAPDQFVVLAAQRTAGPCAGRSSAAVRPTVIMMRIAR
jgi:hypothetical protein